MRAIFQNCFENVNADLDYSLPPAIKVFFWFVSLASPVTELLRPFDK